MPTAHDPIGVSWEILIFLIVRRFAVLVQCQHMDALGISIEKQSNFSKANWGEQWHKRFINLNNDILKNFAGRRSGISASSKNVDLIL